MGVTADGFRLRITTPTPSEPKTDWEYEERLLYPCRRSRQRLAQEGDTESQETKQSQALAQKKLADNPPESNP